MSIESIAELPGRFKVTLATDTGIANADLEGFWSEADFNRFRPALLTVIHRSRAIARRALLAMDATKSGTMSQSLMASIKDKANNLVERGDKVAIISTSSLQTMQLKRVPGVDSEAELDVQFFASRDTAHAWLRA